MSYENNDEGQRLSWLLLLILLWWMAILLRLLCVYIVYCMDERERTRARTHSEFVLCFVDSRRFLNYVQVVAILCNARLEFGK